MKLLLTCGVRTTDLIGSNPEGTLRKGAPKPLRHEEPAQLTRK